ncbi:hypothetical protein Tco_0367431 [Tanacetum coccineum]
MVIEEPEYEMLFINVFGDEAFYRMNDIHKVDIETLLTYLVMASNITTPENTRFFMKLRKLIENHPDQEKLKSKKVKLESLGIESYQIKIYLTAPTITYPGIEKDPLYLITHVLFVGIVYENNKKEKRAMEIDELHKFSDATLIKVLRKISVINMEAKHRIVEISLSTKDKELMVLLEEEIKERLKYHLQMRRWESFMNGRQIANYMVCPE